MDMNKLEYYLDHMFLQTPSPKHVDWASRSAELGFSLLKLARAHTTESKGKQSQTSNRSERKRDGKTMAQKPAEQSADASHQRKQHALALQNERLRMDFRVYARFEEFLDYETQLLAEISQMEALSDKMDRQIEHLDEMITTRTQSVAAHQMVDGEVQSALVEGSKLQYELGVLEERIKEADDFMDDFEQKASYTIIIIIIDMAWHGMLKRAWLNVPVCA
ncbi:hypothetical protein SYNPS1DRAFT_21156 [Syncephalis pseudoplumigaleata]|uniref:Uncharacterized protein n=1 Tax=Syncephalis pseudoplumigaleata TaxID=1712513 RepID=A0A4P9Z3Z7_9FUNG|nr:hypothetical protein SYNPS1DRAFT_21156 [Syncephalis pseudoplumigaleata]|eukprot:RKP27283.1 hypothetical protein SYNPS1DRAFT_21156 [Syncephalis pseudoplumigaleata]